MIALDMFENLGVKDEIVIDGKYELLKQIRQGTLIKTYLAKDKNLDKVVVAKISEKHCASTLINEAYMLKRTCHPALPKIVDIIESDIYFCVIEDYLEGITLQDVLGKYGVQTQENVIEWAKQLCDVLGYLHSQNPPCFHKSIEPANIILKSDGNIALINFDFINQKKEKNLEAVVLKMDFIAPECYKGIVDARSDVYSLGMTLYNLLTGIDPRSSDFDWILDVCRINTDLSKKIGSIVNKCIEYDPNKRYQTMQELRTALDKACNNLYASPGVFGSTLKKGLKGIFGKKKSANPNETVTEQQKPEIKLAECENGHIYNSVENFKCPVCAKHLYYEKGLSSLVFEAGWYYYPSYENIECVESESWRVYNDKVLIKLVKYFNNQKPAEEYKITLSDIEYECFLSIVDLKNLKDPETSLSKGLIANCEDFWSMKSYRNGVVDWRFGVDKPSVIFMSKENDCSDDEVEIKKFLFNIIDFFESKNYLLKHNNELKLQQ